MVSPEGTQDGGKWAACCQVHLAVSHCSHPDGVPEEAQEEQAGCWPQIAEVHNKGVISVNSASCIFPCLEKC